MSGDRVTRVVQRTARQISAALDKMEADLPEWAAPQMATELVVADLTHRQPWYMRLIMEDPYIKEMFWGALAELPATTRPRERGKTRSSRCNRP